MDLSLPAPRFGLAAWHTTVGTPSGEHVHAEIELNLPLSGTARCVTVFGEVELPPGRLAAFWGGYPHRLVVTEPTEFAWLTIPLTVVGDGPQLQGAVEAVLGGAVLLADPDDAALDLLLVRRWARDLREGSAAAAEATLSEVRGRLTRLAPDGRTTPVAARASYGAERLLRHVAHHYTEDLTVADIAKAAGVHPTYAAHAFRSAFSLSLWEYVIQLRIAHARRLLLATDWDVDHVAHASGFGSRSSFYRAFTARVGTTPTHYRRHSRSRDVAPSPPPAPG